MTPPSLFASHSPPNLAAPRTHTYAANNVNEGAGIRIQVHTNGEHMYTRTCTYKRNIYHQTDTIGDSPVSFYKPVTHTSPPRSHHASHPLQACTFLKKSRLRTRGTAAVTAAVERRCASAPSSIRTIREWGWGWGWGWGLSQILVGWS
jgi:hypothetical protein